MKMNHNDALHILNLTSVTTIDKIKLAYRKACSQYHPDRNPAGLEMMKIVNAAYDALEDVLAGGQFDRSVKNEKEGAEEYGEQINAALNAIINLGLTIEICGSWIWVSGDTRTFKDTLKNAGFKWAPKKMMWHFRPAEYKSFNRGKWNMDKIRETHGSTTIRNRSFQQLSA
jgi:curved DNA-binding protein CbpA